MMYVCKIYNKFVQILQKFNNDKQNCSPKTSIFKNFNLQTLPLYVIGCTYVHAYANHYYIYMSYLMSCILLFASGTFCSWEAVVSGN